MHADYGGKSNSRVTALLSSLGKEFLPPLSLASGAKNPFLTSLDLIGGHTLRGSWKFCTSSYNFVKTTVACRSELGPGFTPIRIVTHVLLPTRNTFPAYCGR